MRHASPPRTRPSRAERGMMGNQGSRAQSLHHPFVRFGRVRTTVSQAVVHPVGPPLPELHAGGDHAISAPEVRQGHLVRPAAGPPPAPAPPPPPAPRPPPGAARPPPPPRAR